METIYLCPGRIDVEHKDQRWYIPVYNGKKNTIYYCEACFKKYSQMMKQLQFELEIGTMHHCEWNKNFVNSSVNINNVRISVVNQKTLYRYTIKELTNETIKVGLPNKTSYMIVVENWNENKDEDVRISIDNIKHGNISNTYYSEYKDKLIIDSMSYISELIYNESSNNKNNNNNGNENVITFTITKWNKQKTGELRGYYKMVNPSFNIRIELVTDDSEIEKMNNLIIKYKKHVDEKHKIIIVNDFI
jgi:hypothetical protein